MADYSAVAEALEDRYRFVRELGAGGMATVVLATDLRHDRDVAVKLLKPELSSAVGTERFLREIRITAKLNHPHILPLIDSGEADGILFYVTPHVAGGSLRKMLVQHGRLDCEAAEPIARQVAAALDYAHGEGVVHRDVKPENILFSQGHAIVADFGIGRALSSAGGDHLTRSGFPLGTPGYMSPEQAAGRIDVTGQVDVFGLGCVTYEMVVGETPEFWPTDESLRVGRFLDTSVRHRERLDSLPGRLEQVLVKALALRPSDRFPSPGAFAAAVTSAVTDRPRVSDTDVEAILERAASLDASGEHQDHALTIGAIEQAAAEVGIAPEHVRAAAKEVARVAPASVGAPASSKVTASSASPARYLPRPEAFSARDRKVTIERTIHGEVSEELYERIVTAIHDTMGLWGHSSVMGRTLTWSPAQGSSSRNVLVTVTPRGGKTNLHIEERFEMAGGKQYLVGPGAALGALFCFATFSALGVSDAAVVIPALFGAAGGAWLSERGLTYTSAMDRQPELDRLADKLEEILESDIRN